MPPQRTGAPAAKRLRLGERTNLACSFCKSKKLKCDGQSPKCQNCVKGQQDCLVEDPATGLHRPRDYMQSLEARVAYLESLLQQARPDVALDHLAVDGDPGESVMPGSNDIGTSSSLVSSSMPREHQMKPQTFPDQTTSHLDHSRPPPGYTQRPSPAPMSDVGGNSEADVLSSEVALLCLSAAGREPHYFGPSSAVSFSRIASTTMGLGHRGGSQRSVVSPSEDPKIIHDRDVQTQFPAPDVAVRLARAYWTNIHPQYPFLHRPTFELWEQDCLRAHEQGTLRRLNPTRLFFTLMVYAIGSLALGQGEHDNAEIYYSLALDNLSPVLDLDTLESIQALLACAVYSIRSVIGISLWKISGLAIRHCVELGYHRSAEKYRRNVNPLVKEMSRRCFWVAYDIDRVAAFHLGRPVSIPDGAIDAELPLDLDDEYIAQSGLLRGPRDPTNEPPMQITGAIHSIKLRQLWSKFSDLLYPIASQPNRTYEEETVRSLRQELENWRMTAPDRQDFNQQTLSVWNSPEWLQVAYNHSILLLYRHHITRTSNLQSGVATGIGQQDQGHGAISAQAASNREESIETAIEDCYWHGREICLLYRRLYQKPTIQFTWGSIHMLFLGGLTFVYCLWRSARLRSKARQADVASTCMACSTVLIIIAERWNLATSYRDIFEVLSERTIRMICGEWDNPSSGPQDMRGDAWGAGSFGTNGADGVYAPGDETAQQQPGQVQDWIMGLNDIGIPPESEWLVQALLQGVRDFEPDTGQMNMSAGQ